MNASGLWSRRWRISRVSWPARVLILDKPGGRSPLRSNRSKRRFHKDTALIEYVRYFHYLGKSKFEFHYGAVVFSTDAPPRWVTLGSAKEIEATLKRYQAFSPQFR